MMSVLAKLSLDPRCVRTGGPRAAEWCCKALGTELRPKMDSMFLFINSDVKYFAHC